MQYAIYILNGYPYAYKVPEKLFIFFADGELNTLHVVILMTPDPINNSYPH